MSLKHKTAKVSSDDENLNTQMGKLKKKVLQRKKVFFTVALKNLSLRIGVIFMSSEELIMLNS